ncbi:nitroreductase/quinone reductase family protein [Nocardia sp. NPDC051030]|uniref:nitroreductase/quinone reductase family protein n=1 Tax=Nocardia sp. NPDC051030 TaxID=3155162 RepID=UPI00343D1CE0
MSVQTAPPTVPGYVNWFVKKVLRSPLHRVMSGNTMMMTVTGRKSGTKYVVVVRYVRDGDAVTCYTDSKWWINLRGGAPVDMLIAGETQRGIATPITDVAVVAENLSKFLHAMPSDSKYYGVGRNADGTPNAEEIRKAAAITTMVRIVPAT